MIPSAIKSNPNWDRVPAELRELPQWVVWKLEARKGQPKPTKIPYQAWTGDKADSTDAATWATFEAARAAFLRGGYSGIGFVFSPADPYAGIDLDGCRNIETGEIAPWAAAILSRLNSYSEVSPSGSGVKIIVRAVHPGQGFRKALKDGTGYEMYDAARYFTVTGQALPDFADRIVERHGEFAAIHREIFTGKEKASPKVKPAASRSAGLPDDAVLLEKARNAGRGTFAALYDGGGQGYGSQSEADLALCGMLAFWTGGDLGRMDRLFRASALMRDKWDERRGDATYGERTLNLSMVGRTEFYGTETRSASAIAAAVTGPGRPPEQQSSQQQSSEKPQPEKASPTPNSRANDSRANDDKLDAARQAILAIWGTDDSVEVKRIAISRIVQSVLAEEGQLHRDADGGLWYFHSGRHDLLRLPTGKLLAEEFSSRLALRFGLNRTEKTFNYVLADIVDTARALPRVSTLRTWSHYDSRTERLYVSDGNGFMYRLDGQHICRLFNGEDGVLFAALGRMTALGDLEELLENPLDAPPEPGDGLLEHILSVNFEDTPDLSATAQAALWYGYVYSLPFESILPTKPLVTFVGEKGSGKSVALKRLSRLLLGPGGNVSPLPPKVEDFDAALYNSRFLWLDNVDTYAPWLMDALACASTGQDIVRREYFTNMGLLRFTPHCWLGLTTREPKFRRDDVADRSLLLSLSRLSDDQRVSEHSLMQAIDDRRDALFAEYLRDLNKIVAHLRRDKAPLRIEARLADWGEFFLRFMRLHGREDEGHAALTALSQEQMSFSVTGDPLYEILEQFVPETGWTPEMDAAMLCKELMTLAESEKREVHFKPHTIGKRLQNSTDAIHRAYQVIVRDGRMRQRFYRFCRRLELNESGESGESESAISSYI